MIRDRSSALTAAASPGTQRGRGRGGGASVTADGPTPRAQPETPDSCLGFQDDGLFPRFPACRPSNTSVRGTNRQPREEFGDRIPRKICSARNLGPLKCSIPSQSWQGCSCSRPWNTNTFTLRRRWHHYYCKVWNTGSGVKALLLS